MPEINWQLLQPVDVGSQVQQGFATGAAMMKHAQTRHALKDYLANPDDPKAFSALAYYDPQTAHQFQQQRLLQDKLAREQEEIALTRRLGTVAATDPSAARTQALQAGQLDLAEQFGKLDDAARERTAKFWTEAAPLAFKLRQLKTPEERQALFQQARPILESTGVDPAQLDRFDPTNDTQLDAAIATGQKVSDLIEQGRVTWHQQGEQPSFATDFMGRPVGSQNPARIDAPGSGIEARNNPGALRKPGSMEFQSFGSPGAGVAAQEAQLGRYISGAYNGTPLRTVSDIVETYAPRKSRGGDNTDEQVNNYKAYVSRRIGIDPNTPIDPANVPKLAAAMREFETGKKGGGQLRVASTGGIPHVGSKADYDRLPKGLTYIAPDGSKRVKG